MIKREFNAVRMNRILNHPSVRPWLLIPGFEEIDISHHADDERNYILMGDGGGCWLHYRMPGVYEGHIAFVDGKRGRGAYASTAEVLRFMFTQTDCHEIYLRIPNNNVSAQTWVESFGFAFDYSRLAWPEHNGLSTLNYYSMNFNDWMRSQRGQEDHKRRQVFDEMLMAGQTDKGYFLYNKWAMLIGKPLLQRG